MTLKTRNKVPEERVISDKTKKEHQKLLEQLLKVDYQEGNCDATFGSIREFRHDATEAEASLGLTKFALSDHNFVRFVQSKQIEISDVSLKNI